MGFAVQIRYYEMDSLSEETRTALIYLAENGGGCCVKKMGGREYFFEPSFTDFRSTFLGTLRAREQEPPTEAQIAREMAFAKEEWGYDDDEARQWATTGDTSVADEKARLRSLYGDAVYDACERAVQRLDAMEPTGSLFF